MEQLRGALEDLLDRTIIDSTGINGYFDFSLDWTESKRQGAVEDRDAVSAQDIDIWTAVQEQLGLKVTSAKAPVQILVIDHIERPSPN